jgi:hypothetical protein
MSRLVYRAPSSALVECIQVIHDTWDHDFDEDYDIMPIIYQIYKIGIPLEIEVYMLKDLKTTFEAKDPLLELIMEMVDVQFNYLGERLAWDPPRAKYDEFMSADRFRSYKRWRNQWDLYLECQQKRFNATSLAEFTGSILKSLANYQLRV